MTVKRRIQKMEGGGGRSIFAQRQALEREAWAADEVDNLIARGPAAMRRAADKLAESGDYLDGLLADALRDLAAGMEPKDGKRKR